MWKGPLQHYVEGTSSLFSGDPLPLFLAWLVLGYPKTLLRQFLRQVPNHSHVHSRRTVDGSSECSSIHDEFHVSVGDYQHRRKSLKQTDKQIWERGANDMQCKRFISMTHHANDHYSLSFVHIEWFTSLAHQNRIIAIASNFRVDGAKSPEILQKACAQKIAAWNRKSLATFHRTLKSQCSIAFSCLGNRCDFWGLRWASQSQIAKIAAISVRYPDPPILAFLKFLAFVVFRFSLLSLCDFPSLSRILGEKPLCLFFSGFPLLWERPKRDDDNWEPHLVDHQMLHLKPLFHFTIQKR